jgi:hypothetical protein
LEFEFEGPYDIGDGKQQWLAVNNILKIVVSGESQEDAFNEALISLNVMLAYHHKLKLNIRKA